MGRRGWSRAALVVVLLVIIAAPTLLAVRQATSWDETQTLAQTHDSTLGTLRANCSSTFDTCPAAYYGGVWSLSRAGVGLLGLRLVSIAGWVVGSIALGAVMVRRGGRTGSVIVAVAGLSASGLFGQSMVARPYGLTVGALACAVWAWERSFARPSPGGAVFLAVMLTAAASLHYSSLVSVGCLFLAELLALRWDRTRTKAYLGAFVACFAASGLLLLFISKSMNAARGGASTATIIDLPNFYLGMVEPAVLPLLLAAAGLALWWLVLGRRSGRSGDAPPRPSLHQRTADAGGRITPFLVGIGLLAAVVPALVIGAIALTHGQYFHRYALGGVIGLVLVAAEATRHLERARPAFGVAAAAVVLASIPIAWLAVTNQESPTRAEVAQIARQVGVSDHDGTIVVADAYLRGLLMRETDGATDDQFVLGGPPETIVDRPAFDLREPAAGPVEPERVLLIATADQLAEIEALDRVVVHRQVGSAHLVYGARDEEIVGVDATVVPA